MRLDRSGSVSGSVSIGDDYDDDQLMAFGTASDYAQIGEGHLE